MEDGGNQRFRTVNEFIKCFHQFVSRIFSMNLSQFEQFKKKFLIGPKQFFFLSLRVEKEIMIRHSLKKFVESEFEVGETIWWIRYLSIFPILTISGTVNVHILHVDLALRFKPVVWKIHHFELPSVKLWNRKPEKSHCVAWCTFYTRFIEPGWSIPVSRRTRYNVKGTPRNST